MTVEWEKYRGPGTVTFTPAKQPLDRRQGRRPPPASASRATTRSSPSSTTDRASRRATSAITAAGPNSDRQGHRRRGADDQRACGAQPRRSPIAKDVAPHLPGQVHAVPSRRHRRADVADDLRRGPAVGAVDPPARREPRDAAVASRQDRRHPPLQERSVADRRARSPRSCAGWTPTRRAATPPTCRRRRRFAPEDVWHIGKPDLVVKMDKPHTMYAKGPDWWIDYFADTGLTEDRWIKAMEVRPGNRRIVHHTVVYAIEPDAPAGTPETGVHAARVRRRQVRRHLQRQHRPPAQGGHAPPLRHALLRDRRGADRSDRDRVHLLPEGRDAEVRSAVDQLPEHPERRARDSAELGRPPRRLLPAARGRRASTPSSRTCTCAARR